MKEKKLHILILEDNVSDAELMNRELRRSGLKFDFERVETKKTFIKSLDEFQPDLVLADYNLPSFDGLSALKLSKQKAPDVPFIIISGLISEELAVEIVKSGATDYVFKERLSRLIPSVTRALQESEDRDRRKQAERQLRESERKLRQIIDLVPHFIFVKDHEGKYLLVNKAVAEAYGTTINNVLNHTDDDLSDKEEEARRAREDDAYVIKQHRVRVIPDQIFTDHEGRTRTLQTVKMPFAIEGSEISAVLGVSIDITESIQSEEKIREQAALLNIATDAIIVRNMDDSIVFWNKGAETIYGWSVEEALGKSVRELLFKHNKSQFNEALSSAVQRNNWDGEVNQTTKDGRNIVVESRWTPVRGNDGEPKSILILNTDISEKKRFEAQVLRAQRMESIGTLAGGIAHDLNNVLVPILLTFQNLRKKLPDERSRRLLNTVELSTKRGAEMIQQVLAFTRGADGEKIVLQPRHLIEEIDKIVRETFQRSVRIQTKTTRDLWMLRGDATQLHQVLMNLCVNARDAMPKGGSLMIEAENVTLNDNFARMNIDAKPGSFVLITVSDTGTGIVPELIDKIFEPFFTTKEIGKGTGLGLSTVLAIVKGHGGFINVYSEVGKGTKFKVYLPAIVTRTETKKTQAKKPELPLGHGESILVVDDEESICEITKETLENYGYTAMTASDGAEAVALFTQNKGSIKAVLTDMMMPHMDGAATIRALKKIDPGVRIIAASGLMTDEKIAESGKAGIQAYLQKPYTAEKLLTTLNDVLQKKR
jgi:PAS domain S-box-containing protein